jgi:hypothetical protein
MDIETDPEECKNCRLERKISEAYANALNNGLFQARGKRNAVYCSDGSPWRSMFNSMQRFETDEMLLTGRLERLEEKVYMKRMTSKMATDVVLPVQEKVFQVMDQTHDHSLTYADDSSNIGAHQGNREEHAEK